MERKDRLLPVPVIEILAVRAATFEGAGEAFDVARVVDRRR